MNTGEMTICIIHLNNGKIQFENRQDLKGYIGGVSLGTQLLKEYCLLDKSPLHPRQPIIFTKGPLNTIFPAATKTCAMFKSPLTGELGESYAGLRMALAMGMAGIIGIIILGKAKNPVYLHICGQKVSIQNASSLWNLNTDETTRLLHDQPGRRGLRSILTIGSGGEKQIRYASVSVDTYRHFGRLGLGCLMGSKNLKAIVIEGDHHQPVENLKEYRRVYQRIFHKVTETDIMEKYHGLGTSANILALNDMEALPSYNFKDSVFNKAYLISGENFAQKRLIKKISCSGCPVGCIHIALLRKKFKEPYEYKSSMISYDHELIYALGSNLGIGDMDSLLELIETVELLGLDAISTGVLLSWITEAYEKRMITEREVLEKPSYGDAFACKKIIQYIIEQPNDFYRAASRGTYYLASQYGGEDFAMVLGKTEAAGYHTGYGNIIGQLVGARHSHLDNAGYAIDQGMENISGEQLAEKLIEEEMDRNVLNSLVACLFSRKVYDYQTMVEALNSIGYGIDEDTLRNLGFCTFMEKIELKNKMGLNIKKEPIPKRFFETLSCGRKLYLEEAEEIVKTYMKKVERLRKKFEGLRNIQNTYLR